jgi:hypothetical protein
MSRQLTHVCRAAEGQLDYLVLTNPGGPSARGSLVDRTRAQDGKDVTYYMYACRDLL